MNNTETLSDSVYNFYKLKECLDPKQLFWWDLVLRDNAIPFIEKHIDLLDNECLKNLSRNPFAVDMLERHKDKILWNDFVNNPNAIHVIEKNLDLCFKSLHYRGRSHLLRHPNFIHILENHNHKNKIINEMLFIDCLSDLAKQPKPIYIDILEKYMKKCPEKIPDKSSGYFWNILCENPEAIRIIENHLDKLTICAWQLLAKNSNAIHIIKEHLDNLYHEGWRNLCENPSAIPILEENIDKIDWYGLSKNPNGIYILEKYPEKIKLVCYTFVDYKNFSINSPIFEIDYDSIMKRCSIYKEELMAIALHPSRIEKYLALGINIEELDNYI